MFVEDYTFWITYNPDTGVIWGSGKSKKKAFGDACTYVRGWNSLAEDEQVECNLLTIPAMLEIEKALFTKGGDDIDWEVVDGIGQLK